MQCFETREFAEAAIDQKYEGVHKPAFFGPTACIALGLYGAGWYVWDNVNRKVAL